MLQVKTQETAKVSELVVIVWKFLLSFSAIVDILLSINDLLRFNHAAKHIRVIFNITIILVKSKFPLYVKLYFTYYARSMNLYSLGICIFPVK